MQEIKIYVGLNDSKTKDQKFDNAVYISILKKVCYNYHVAFSFNLIEGGYFHEDGAYTQENSLVLTLIDTESDTANEIAQDLCSFFHQESVLMTFSEIKAVFIKSDIGDMPL